MNRDTGSQSAAGRISELEGLVNYLLDARENEKRKLARQLHDQFGSILISAKMDVESVAAKLTNGPADVLSRLQRSQAALKEAVELKRRLIEDLRPSLLDNLGLAAALEWQVTEACGRVGIECCVEAANDIPVGGAVPIVLFRIVEQAVGDVIKSATAKKVSVAVTIDGERIRLLAKDDGRPVPVTGESPESYEIAGLRLRVKALGGDFTVRSGGKNGNVLEVSLPWTPPKAPS